MLFNSILVRYGEIALKGKNRPEFEGQLKRQVQQALDMANVPVDQVERAYGRIVVDLGTAPPDALARAVQAMSRVFGIVSFSPAVRLPVELENPLEGVAEAAWALVQEEIGMGSPGSLAGRRPRSFKVDARRAYKRFPMSSLEINRELGAALLRRGIGLPVEVHNPDLTVSVEVRQEGIYVSTREYPGPGGLPYGVTGKAVLLLSGGIDSPVAGWMSMRRGIEVVGLHFHSYPFTSEEALRKAEDLGRVLARWAGGKFRLRVCHFTEVQKAIQRHVPEELRITIMRRMMFRIAERIAAQEEALALITGENVAQVASQTLESLGVIEAVTQMPVLRPLAMFDKMETIAKAKEIGTYEISIRPYEDCCTIFTPVHPKTRPRLAEAEAAEEALAASVDIEQLLAAAVDSTASTELEPLPE
ncbi:MAG: tRNA 4-thiouridine(8) synthase ThiI [Limnochordales bacterium]|nr:tRNA 4-thiouridine(8) synthase ThiI [Limnochordales bacterium]